VMDSNQRRTTPTVLQSDPRVPLTSTNADIVVAAPGIPREILDRTGDPRMWPDTSAPPAYGHGAVMNAAVSRDSEIV
jgi:hypothetical protein